MAYDLCHNWLNYLAEKTMEVLIEYTLTVIIVAILIAFVLYAYFKKNDTETKINVLKIDKAKEYGFHEPISLHPVKYLFF